MQSPRRGLFSRFSEGLGLSKPSKSLERDGATTAAISEARRPPVGGGRHDDDEDDFPAAQVNQPSLAQREDEAQVQEGTEGSKAVGSQPASEFSEIQPASSSEDVSGQIVFATPYKNTAISKLMSETKGPSTTVPPSVETSGSQAANVSSPVPEQQPRAAQPVEQAALHTADPIEPSLTSERVQNVAGFDSANEGAPVQGQNMATGGFRSSSGVPSEDELNQLYTSEVGAQGGTGQRSKVDTETGDLPDNLNIGFSGKGSGIYGSFATGKPAARGPQGSQTMETMQGQGSVPSVMQLPETEEFRTYHQPEGIAAQEAAPVPTSAVTPSQGGEQLYQHESAGPYPAAEGSSSATLPAALDRPQQALAPAEQHTPPHSEAVPNFSTPLTDESEAVPAETNVSEQGPDRKQLGAPQTPLPHLDIPPTFEPEHYTPPQQDIVSQSEAVPPPTMNPERLASPQQHPIQNSAVSEARMTPPQYSSHPKFGFDTHTPPELTPVEPQSAPVSDFNNMQLTQNVGESGSQPKTALGGQTGSQEEVPIGSGQPASLQEQQEGQAVPTAYEGYQSQESAQPYAGQQVSTGSGGDSGSQLNFQPFSIVGADADTWSHYKGQEQYPATPERLNRQPQPASPEEVQGGASATPGSAHPASGATVAHETEYSSPVTTEVELQQEPPLSGNRGVADIPNYPRENPLFDEEQQQQQEQQQEVEPEAEPTFYENPEFDSAARTGQQSLGSPMIPSRASTQQQQTYDSPAYTQEQNIPAAAQDPVRLNAEDPSSLDIPPQLDEGQYSYGQPYESSDMHRALSETRPVPSAAVTAANHAVEQEVLVNSAAQPEADTVSNTAEDGYIGESEVVEPTGAGVGHVTSTPQLGGVHEEVVAQVIPEQEIQQEIAAEPVIDTEIVAPEPVEQVVSVQETFVPQERVLPPTYSGPQIVSKDAALTPLPPSASWGAATSFAPYTAPARATPYVPPTQVEVVQETVVVEEPVVEVETAMVEQDPPIDPSVERATPVEPSLPVSTRTTGMLTSTPQLGPATAAPATPEVLPATVGTVGMPLPTPMTREEITSYRPAQDPAIDPSQGQCPVQVSTDLVEEARPPPPPPVMSTAEIAAYRSAEDPAYDPVQRRGWWEVDMTQGGGTILPTTTRGPRRGRGGSRGAGRSSTPALTGPHIYPGGDPSQATHFGSVVSGARAGGVPGRGLEQIGAAPGVYDTPPLAGQTQAPRGGRYASGAPLTPTPTPVAPLGDGETRNLSTTFKPLAQDPVYDPTEGASGSALPSAGNDQIDNPLFEEQQQQDISGTEYDQVESASGLQRDVTHRGEQVGTPHFARQQQQPSAFGAAPAAGGRAQDIVTRPVVRSARRPPRTVHLTDIGRPAPLPPVQEQYVAPEPKPEELGAVDVLPQDDHYVKPTAYDELGANARSALSGAGWKTTWAMEMEAAAQRGGQALKYPVGPVVPQGASGFGPKASTAMVGEPDYAALARGEPGFTVPGADLQDTPPLGPTPGASGEVAPQPSYMQLAAPPVHPGAPVVDRGFTGPGGASGGARRRLASKLFERQHSLQDPSFDPVSQRFGRDEGYGVELPVHRPPHVPTGRASTGLPSDQGLAGGASRGSRASSQAGYGMRQPQYEEEEIIPEEEQIQEEQEQVQVVDKTKEMNERLLVEVRRRLQAARSQLNSAPPSEADAGTPVDSPLGGRPRVLQNRTAEGTPGYWRTLEEVEAEASDPVGRNAPSPWVQTRGPELVPRRLFQAGGASSGFGGAPRMTTGPVSQGRVTNKGLEGYGSGRVHNIAGGYPNRVSRGGNQYSWGRQGVF